MTSTDEDQEMAAMIKANDEYLAIKNLIRERKYSQYLREFGHDPAITMIEPFSTDEYGTMTIGEWGGWWVQIMPMIFNDRLVLTPKRDPLFIDHGWCFDKGGAAFLAALVWNPQTESDPPGHKKAVGFVPRAAGDTARGLNAVPGFDPAHRFYDHYGNKITVQRWAELRKNAVLCETRAGDSLALSTVFLGYVDPAIEPARLFGTALAPWGQEIQDLIQVWDSEVDAFKGHQDHVQAIRGGYHCALCRDGRPHIE